MRSATAAMRRSRRKIDEIVDLYAAVQLPDGYLNTWYIGREIENRWTNLRDNHELYNAGHLLEGAVAYYQATGRRKFLDIMERYVDHIATMFGPGPGQKRGYPGHEEIEIALVKLYGVTQQQEAPRPRHLLHQRARAAAALLRSGSGGARRRSQEVRAGDLRVFAVAHPGARADQGRGARGARLLSLHRDGGPRGRDRRRRAQEGLRGAVERRHVEAHVRHRRFWACGAQRGFYHRLRPAQRHGLCRDLRHRRDGVLGAEDAEPRSRFEVRRRDGARPLQQRALGPQPGGHALLLREQARERRHPQALGLAQLPVLHDERVAARRLDRRLLLFHRQGPRRDPSLWRQQRHRRPRRHRRLRSRRRAISPGRAR